MIKRADFYRGYTDAPWITTGSGVELGMTEEAQLRRARLRNWDYSVRRAHYGGPSDHEIVHRVTKINGRTFVYKYETRRVNGVSRVQEVLAGHGDAASLVEGCV